MALKLPPRTAAASAPGEAASGSKEGSSAVAEGVGADSDSAADLGPGPDIAFSV